MNAFAFSRKNSKIEIFEGLQGLPPPQTRGNKSGFRFMRWAPYIRSALMIPKLMKLGEIAGIMIDLQITKDSEKMVWS